MPETPTAPQLTTQFVFTVEQSVGRRGLDIAIHRHSDGKVVSFFLAGDRTPEPLWAHMRSLTDDQCAAFYPDAKQRKDKKDKTQKQADAPVEA